MTNEQMEEAIANQKERMFERPANEVKALLETFEDMKRDLERSMERVENPQFDNTPAGQARRIAGEAEDLRDRLQSLARRARRVQGMAEAFEKIQETEAWANEAE